MCIILQYKRLKDNKWFLLRITTIKTCLDKILLFFIYILYKEIHFKEISYEDICTWNECLYVLSQVQFWLKTNMLRLALKPQFEGDDMYLASHACWKTGLGRFLSII